MAQHMPAETWGEQLRRARAKRPLMAVAAEVSEHFPCSHMTVARLEGLAEVPAAARRRALAALVVDVYGVTLESFGLTAADRPGPARPVATRARITSASRTYLR